MIKGAERAAASAGLTLVLGDTAENAGTEAQLIQRLERAVDGFVISASRLTDDELRTAAQRSPIALVNRATAGLGCVVADFDSGTRQIVDHLASYGHRSLVFVGGPAESWSGARRLTERGRSVPGDLSVVGFDNVFGAEFCHPTLTTLAERTEEAGTRAVELLAQQVSVRQVEGPTRVLATHLVVRASTGPVTGDVTDT